MLPTCTLACSALLLVAITFFLPLMRTRFTHPRPPPTSPAPPQPHPNNCPIQISTHPSSNNTPTEAYMPHTFDVMRSSRIYQQLAGRERGEGAESRGGPLDHSTFGSARSPPPFPPTSLPRGKGANLVANPVRSADPRLGSEARRGNPRDGSRRVS